MYKYETEYLNEGYKYIAGCDEVGRGPMAGPVVCAAVILNPDSPIEGLYDSKALSDKLRRQLSDEIKDKALSYHIEYITPETVDKLNVYQASKRGMEQALTHLDITPQVVLVDAMTLNISTPQVSIIKGDQLSASIAAASIIAKVARDDYMINIAKTYPDYYFEKHKGYPTKLHKEQLIKYGPTPIHRKSYQPVKDVLMKQMHLKV